MRFFVASLLLVLLGACSTPQEWASNDRINAVAYRDPGPAKLTLLTMVNNRTGSGAHSSLMINGRQRILFDPAGSFKHHSIPERSDVLFGISPAVFTAYRGAHARQSHHVVIQEIEVTPEQAEVAFQLALNNGAVPGAFCTNATSGLLSKVPGFQDINVTFYPNKLSAQLEGRPGVTTTRYYEDDDPNLDAALTDLKI